jgi:Cysteine-rich CWC
MSAVAKPRSLRCARCGAAFECGSMVGQCWCAEQGFRLPMPVDSSEDCLCPACLRAAALAAHP